MATRNNRGQSSIKEQYGNRGRSGTRGRSNTRDSYDNRGGGSYNNRGGGSYDNRGGGSYENRGGGSYENRGGGYRGARRNEGPHNNRYRNTAQNDTNEGWNDSSRNNRYRSTTQNEYKEERSERAPVPVIENEVKLQKDMNEPVDEVKEFDEIVTNPFILRGIYESGFKYPSQIQRKSMKIVLDGHDILAQSQSGSGKTAAYLIPVISRYDFAEHRQYVMIIVNTRDLADQVYNVAKSFIEHTNIKIEKCIGGVRNTEDKIANAHIIVGTPGKVNELIESGVIDSKNLKTLVLDEADALLHDNFREQTMYIIGSVSKQTQLCVFSATFTHEIIRTTNDVLNNPYRITVVNEELSVKGIYQYRININCEESKYLTLVHLFSSLTFTQLIIFVRSIDAAERLRERLIEDDGISACVVHGRMSQLDRERTLREFRLCSINVLITTDLMCRGIDIDDLRLVINYDMPDTKETYLHRVGRSGRFGGGGVAINICTSNDDCKIIEFQREYKIQIPEMPVLEEVNDILTRCIVPPANKATANNFLKQ